MGNQPGFKSLEKFEPDVKFYLLLKDAEHKALATNPIFEELQSSKDILFGDTILPGRAGYNNVVPYLLLKWASSIFETLELKEEALDSYINAISFFPHVAEDYHAIMALKRKRPVIQK